nr:reverse transcriptase domain-containing protein [Tanacetum cinerariifolium]
MSIPYGLPPAGPPPPQNNNGPPLMVRPNGPAPRLMEELCQSSINGRGRPIGPIPIQAMDFGLRRHMIQQVQNSCQFHGLPGDDANRHFDKFLEITQYMEQNGVSDDALRLSLFPYSLTHHATAWYDRLSRNSIHSIHTLDDMMRKFLSKYFPPSMVKDVDTKCETCGGSHSYTECPTVGGYTQEAAYATTGSLPSNTVANPRGDIKAITTQSGVAYDGTTILPTPFPLPEEVERETEATKDKVQPTRSESNSYIQPLVVQVPILEPNVAPKTNPKPSIPYPSRLNDQKLRKKANNQMMKFLQIFQRLHFDISFADALLHMPEFAYTFKGLLSNKEKLFELASTQLNEKCLAVLLKKLPKKLRDPSKILIPCDFPELEECLALADLGASINLMPLFVWQKLSLPELTSTRMNLELINRSVIIPTVDYDVDPRVPLILERHFLRTARALIDVQDSLTSGNPTPLDPIIASSSPSFTPFEGSDFILKEIKTFLCTSDELSNLKDDYYDMEGDIHYLENLLNEDPSLYLPLVKNDDLKQVDITMMKPSIEEPPELELKDLPSHLAYAF